MTIEIASFILSTISTIAAVISTIMTISAKKEIHRLKNRINGDNNVQNSGQINVSNKGNNQGLIIGVNNNENR